MNSIDLLAKACELTQRQVEAATVAPGAQTGCADWTAEQLVNHMVASLGMWADIISGETPEINPFDPPHLLGDDMVADYRSAADRAIQAFGGAGVMDQVFPGPAGELPGAAMITISTYDVYVHGWDMAQATGLDGEYPDDLTALAMGFSQQAFADERPPHIVGPEVVVGPDASALDRLLGLNGRQP